MGLRSLLARSATGRVHALVVEVPGCFLLRVAVEREVAARGWVLAVSPADADLLVVCGTPGEQLAGPVDRVYDAMPGPRARVTVSEPGAAAQSLDHGRDVLLDDAHQAADARDRASATQATPGAGHQDTGHQDTDHGDMDHGDMDHGDMGHGDMEMAPSGIPLASGAEDRDGLEMDVLHLPLGPVLPHWPPGLVLTCTLHGDVVGEATVEQLPAPPPTAEHDPTPTATPTATLAATPTATLAAARRLDAVVSVLVLAGWPEGASAAREARDACLDGAGDVEDRLTRLGRKLVRARTLRWMLRGTGAGGPPAGAVAAEDVAARPGPAATLAGDTYDRMSGLLDEARRVIAGDRVPPTDDEALRDLLPALVTGLDLAAVRLLVAGLAPGLTPQTAEVTHA